MVDGVISSKLFIDSLNPKFTLQEYFWDNGKIMCKAYRFEGLKDGNWMFYTITGKLMYSKKYHKDIFLGSVNYDTIK